MEETREEAPRLAGLLVRQRGSAASSTSSVARRTRGSQPARSSQPSEQHQRALDRPVGAERSDGVAREAPRRNGASESRSVRNARSSRTMRPTKNNWPISTPTLNSSSASGISACGRPIVVKPLAKPKPCSSPNANATTHGWRIVKLVSPAPPPDDLRAEEEDAERDRGVERRQRRARVAERGDRQRDAVRDGERGDRLHQHPAVADDEQQAEHEEQVVDAEQDVLDAEAQVAERPLPAGSSARRG